MWENDLKYTYLYIIIRHGRGYELFPNESYFEGIYVNGILYLIIIFNKLRKTGRDWIIYISKWRDL